ncbi:MAG: hypothetical protein AAGD05_12895 [Bacteroidota bacterium]
MKYLQIICFLTTLSFAVNAQEGTSLEEYRYLTKGYAYQKEMGLDANKAGYTIRKVFESDDQVSIIGMYKENQTSPQALLLMTESTADQIYYRCLPNNQAHERVKEMYALHRKQALPASVQQHFDDALRAYLFASLGPTPSYVPTNRPIAYDAPTKVLPNSSSKSIDDQLQTKGLPDAAGYFPNPPTPSTANQYSTPTPTNTAPAPITTQASAQITINGHLSDRAVRAAPKVESTYRAKGKVVIKVCVDQNGEVTQAKFTQRGSTTFNSELKAIALNSAKASRFAFSELSEQCGTIAYHFK